MKFHLDIEHYYNEKKVDNDSEEFS